jgi:hypothetical protein
MMTLARTFAGRVAHFLADFLETFLAGLHALSWILVLLGAVYGALILYTGWTVAAIVRTSGVGHTPPGTFLADILPSVALAMACVILPYGFACALDRLSR